MSNQVWPLLLVITISLPSYGMNMGTCEQYFGSFSRGNLEAASSRNKKETKRGVEVPTGSSVTANERPLPDNWFMAGTEYLVDAQQRLILTLDTLRERGNDYAANNKSGQKPTLAFDYTTLIEGKNLKSRPTNYNLLKITSKKPAQPDKRPVIIIDPRAGHGPGIAGSKMDSEIGIALENGHPVYLVSFDPNPIPHQTLKDVRDTEIIFINEVAKRHPTAGKPAVIGNCQGGWAAMLVAEQNSANMGPIITNGSPLSYWNSIGPKTPMGYRGGMLGGSWLAHYLSDLGMGVFDGAYLVGGFEDLNPAHTYWTKMYNLYSSIDTEKQRYLGFERWWNSYFRLTKEEMTFIVNNLFVGNKLGKGKVTFGDGKFVDLRNVKNPHVVFASKKDNITPPGQALGWITDVYRSEADLKHQNKIIVYSIHEDTGHLGIFVSGDVARREHKVFLDHVESVEYLPPGLYELKIKGPQKAAGKKLRVSFEERTFADIAKFKGDTDEKSFQTVAQLSEVNEAVYNNFLSSWVKLYVNDQSAKAMAEMNPLRLNAGLLSDLNPMMQLMGQMAQSVKENRVQVSDENPFKKIEKMSSQMIEQSLTLYGMARDSSQSSMFNLIFNNPLVQANIEFTHKMFFPQAPDLPVEVAAGKKLRQSTNDRGPWNSGEPAPSIKLNNATEATTRAILALFKKSKFISSRQLSMFEEFLRRDSDSKNLSIEELRQLIAKQSLILEGDSENALKEIQRYLSPAQKERLSEMIRLLVKDQASHDDPFVKELMKLLK